MQAYKEIYLGAVLLATHYHFQPQNMVFHPKNTRPSNFSGQPQERQFCRAASSSIRSQVDVILRHGTAGSDRGYTFIGGWARGCICDLHKMINV